MNERVDRLVEWGVLEAADDGSVRYTDRFATDLSQREDEIADRSDLVFDEAADSREGERLRTLVDEASGGPELVAALLTLSAYAPDQTLSELAGAAIVLWQFADGPPRADGAPRDFLPVRGEDLPTVVGLFEHSIVYVWLDECEPCDVVRQEYEHAVDAIPEDVGRLAVYGPPAARTLHDEFGVDGGPVSLFMAGDEVHVRQTGVHSRETIERELEALRTAVTTPDS